MSSLIHYFTILTEILVNTYMKNSCLLLITQENIYKGQQPLIIINSTDNFKTNFNSSLVFGCENIIVQAPNTESTISDVEKLIKLSVHRLNDRKYLIFLPNTEQEKFPSLHFVPNVLFVVPIIYKDSNNILMNNGEVILSLRTQRFVGVTENDAVIEIDKWFSRNCSFLKSSNLYPDKINNLKGRKLKIATFTYKPYIIVGKNKI